MLLELILCAALEGNAKAIDWEPYHHRIFNLLAQRWDKLDNVNPGHKALVKVIVTRGGRILFETKEKYIQEKLNLISQDLQHDPILVFPEGSTRDSVNWDCAVSTNSGYSQYGAAEDIE